MKAGQKPPSKNTREENTPNITKPENDLKAAKQTTYTWGRRDNHTEKAKWQSQDQAGLKPYLQPSLQAGERGTEQGGGGNPGVLHTWPWKSPGAWACILLGSSD